MRSNESLKTLFQFSADIADILIGIFGFAVGDGAPERQSFDFKS